MTGKVIAAGKHPIAIVVYVLTVATPGFLEYLKERDTEHVVQLEQKLRDIQEEAIHGNIEANADAIEDLWGHCVTFQDLYEMEVEDSTVRRSGRRPAARPRRTGGGGFGERGAAQAPEPSPMARLQMKAAKAAEAVEHYQQAERPTLRKAAQVRADAVNAAAL